MPLAHTNTANPTRPWLPFLIAAMICGERIAIVMPSIWTWASRGSIEPEKSRPVTMLASVQTLSAVREPASKQGPSQQQEGDWTAHGCIAFAPPPGGVKPIVWAAGYSRPMLQPA